ncbi:hypothetical protein L21SP3_00571 [Sedimentisphaera cyanobacteriorum]|uniref:Glycoside hydrolase family 5 domain-containing protein n=1 Tax=Sedimentisphaera cyanobacteriorum TaxID=1940790 RepID=A0A1Q2HN94_9BACT|nr:hypothetical protein [Sedimentisphaera cyanobacteriorum]AQQ08781.1 hypothetical protein L21SP3_00571 [Sedimentisphaera cyanobacteriorum]
MIRYILAFSAAVLFLAPKAKPQDLGANFNENLGRPLEFTEQIENENIRYVRAFIDFMDYFLILDEERKISGVDLDAIRNHNPSERFAAVKDKSEGRLELISSFKIRFDICKGDVPLLHSEQLEYVFTAAEEFLKSYNLGEKISILVMGNEPMFASGRDSKDYARFISELADRIAGWKKKYGWDFLVFAGSLNKVSFSKHPTIPEVIKVAKRNKNIDGLDIHIHARKRKHLREDFRFIRKKIGFRKKLICTEFSVVWVFQGHLGEPLGEWGEKNGFNPEMKLCEWLTLLSRRAENGNPISAELFEEYFESRSWYPANWYKTFYDACKDYDVYAASGRTFCDMGVRKYREDSKMWCLGSVFSGKFMGKNEDGNQNPSPLLYPEFKAATEHSLNERLKHK